MFAALVELVRYSDLEILICMVKILNKRWKTAKELTPTITDLDF